MTISTTKAITLPAVPATASSQTEVVGSSAWFNELRELLAACEGANKNEKADALFAACISQGVNTGPRLVALAKHMGFDRSHAGARLKKGVGHLWRRSEEGEYTLLS